MAFRFTMRPPAGILQVEGGEEGTHPAFAAFADSDALGEDMPR